VSPQTRRKGRRLNPDVLTLASHTPPPARIKPNQPCQQPTLSTVAPSSSSTVAVNTRSSPDGRSPANSAKADPCSDEVPATVLIVEVLAGIKQIGQARAAHLPHRRVEAEVKQHSSTGGE